MRLHLACWIAALATSLFASQAVAQEGADAAAGEGASTPAAAAPDEGNGQPEAPETFAPAQAPQGAPADGAVQDGAAQGSQPEMDGGTYAVRLRDLESRVDELKEQIRRSHTRLSLLSDTILSGGVGGARAEIKFRNNMSAAFRLTRALFVLDGAVQYNKQDDTGALADQEEIPIFSGSIPPGDHTLQVLVELRGHGYGVFSYLRGYQFEVKSSHSFTVTEGKTIQLEVISWEKGGVTTPLEQRPAIRYIERIKSGLSAGTPPGGGEGGTKESGVSGGFSIRAGKE